MGRPAGEIETVDAGARKNRLPGTGDELQYSIIENVADVNVKINEGFAAERNATSHNSGHAFRTTKPSDSRLSQEKATVKKYSMKDSSGRELTAEQEEYFRDSKVRDEQGRLMVMYHGTTNDNHTKCRKGGPGRRTSPGLHRLRAGADQTHRQLEPQR